MSPPDDRIFGYIIANFSQEIDKVVSYQSEEGALNLYQKAKNIPQTGTVNIIREVFGYQIDGNYIPNTNLFLCFDSDLRPRLLKLIRDEAEVDRLRATGALNLVHPNIAKIDKILFQGSIGIIIMEIYSTTISQVKSFDQSRYFRKMYEDVCGALIHLHSQGQVFVDVKPDNICLDINGNFVLIDIGSIVADGSSDVNTTEAYLPQARKVPVAKKDMDFIMLGFSMIEMLIGRDLYRSFTRTINTLIDTLYDSKIIPDEVTKDLVEIKLRYQLPKRPKKET